MIEEGLTFWPDQFSGGRSSRACAPRDSSDGRGSRTRGRPEGCRPPASRLGLLGLIRLLCYRTTPAQRVWCVTPPTVQLTRKSTELPAASVPLARLLAAVAGRSGAAWAGGGVPRLVAEVAATRGR